MTTDLNVKDRDDKSINVEIDVSSVSFFSLRRLNRLSHNYNIFI